MQCIDIRGDVFSYPTGVNFIGTPEVPLEHQLATAWDQNGVHVSRVEAASRSVISLKAPRSKSFREGPITRGKCANRPEAGQCEDTIRASWRPPL